MNFFKNKKVQAFIILVLTLIFGIEFYVLIVEMIFIVDLVGVMAVFVFTFDYVKYLLSYLRSFLQKNNDEK